MHQGGRSYAVFARALAWCSPPRDGSAGVQGQAEQHLHRAQDQLGGDLGQGYRMRQLGQHRLQRRKPCLTVRASSAPAHAAVSAPLLQQQHLLQHGALEHVNSRLSRGLCPRESRGLGQLLGPLWSADASTGLGLHDQPTCQSPVLTPPGHLRSLSVLPPPARPLPLSRALVPLQNSERRRPGGHHP